MLPVSLRGLPGGLLGGSALTFVLSRNLHRRHLGVEDRADLASKTKAMLEEEGRKRMAEAGKSAGKYRPKSQGCIPGDNPENVPHDSLGEAAEMMNVNSRYVSLAEEVT